MLKYFFLWPTDYIKFLKSYYVNPTQLEKFKMNFLITLNIISWSTFLFLYAIASIPSLYCIYLLINYVLAELSPLLGTIELFLFLGSPFFCFIYFYKNYQFNSNMVNTEDLSFGYYRLLATDTNVILPYGSWIRFLITSLDVLHSWAVPSLGIKLDACPGRLNQTSLFIKREGFFYGQCSEICGTNHAFMPITVEAVDLESFSYWCKSPFNSFFSLPTLDQQV